MERRGARSAARFRTTSSRSTSRRRSTSFPRVPRCGSSRISSLSAPTRSKWNHDFDLRLSHTRGRLDGAPELAFTLRDGVEYVQYGIDAGMDVDEFAPRLSFSQFSQRFFEEIAKFRRPAGVGQNDEGALPGEGPRSWMCRFTPRPRDALSPPSSLTTTSYGRRSRRSPAFGGNQLAPHKFSRRDAGAPDRLRRQARLEDAAGHRARVGGRQHRRPPSRLLFRGRAHDEHERGCSTISADRRARRDGRGDRGGFLSARSWTPLRLPAGRGFPREDRGRRERFVETNEMPIETLYIDEAVEGQQKDAVAELRRTRDGKAVSSALSTLRQPAPTAAMSCRRSSMP